MDLWNCVGSGWDEFSVQHKAASLSHWAPVRRLGVGESLGGDTPAHLTSTHPNWSQEHSITSNAKLSTAVSWWEVIAFALLWVIWFGFAFFFLNFFLTLYLLYCTLSQSMTFLISATVLPPIPLRAVSKQLCEFELTSRLGPSQSFLAPNTGH